MDGKPSIQKLVNDTQVYLTGVWDAMGTTTEARTAALETLREDLEQVLSRARDGADTERDELEAERSTIQDEIAHMATCMEVAAEAPEQGSKGVIQHTAALRTRAAELASLKMERVEQMSALCNEAAGLFQDIGAAIEVRMVGGHRYGSAAGCVPTSASKLASIRPNEGHSGEFSSTKSKPANLFSMPVPLPCP